MAERLGSAAGTEIDREAAALYAHLGFWDQWRKASERAIAADPTNRQIRVTYVNEFFLYNSPEDGRATQKRLLDEEPDERYFLLTAAHSPRRRRSWRRRHRPATPTSAHEPGHAPRAAGPSRGSAGRDRALSGLAQKNRYYHHLTYGAVRVYALGGDAEQATRWLQETIRWGFPCYPLFAEDHMLDPVRKSPQFQRVLAELRAEWERYRQELDCSKLTKTL